MNCGVFRLLHSVSLLIWFMVAISNQVSAAVEATDSSAEPETLNFVLEHAFGESLDFTKRSTIAVKIVDGKPVIASKEINQIPAEMIDAFKELLRQNGLYKLRMKADPNNSASPYVQTSIPSCKLQNSAFKEDLVLHFSSSDLSPSITLAGLVYNSPVNAGIARRCDPNRLSSESLQLKTKLSVAEKVVAQSVPLQAQGPRPVHLSKVDLGASVDAQNPGSSKKQSFFMQYWYIILPIAIISLMGGGDEPPKKGEGTSSSGSGASTQKSSSS